MKDTRTTNVTALITHGYGASLSTYEREDGRDVRRIVVALTPDDVPHLEAALDALRKVTV